MLVNLPTNVVNPLYALSLDLLIIAVICKGFLEDLANKYAARRIPKGIKVKTKLRLSYNQIVTAILIGL